MSKANKIIKPSVTVNVTNNIIVNGSVNIGNYTDIESKEDKKSSKKISILVGLFSIIKAIAEIVRIVLLIVFEM